jgi:RNA polymerase sigma-70 factor (ECF subfamily)
MTIDSDASTLRDQIKAGRRAEEHLLSLLRAELQLAKRDPIAVQAARDALCEALADRIRWGGKPAKTELLKLALPELQAAAAGAMRRERSDHTLQATLLFDDEFLIIRKQIENEWEDRATVIAHAKRRIKHKLIDHARRNKSRLQDFIKAPKSVEDMELPHRDSTAPVPDGAGLEAFALPDPLLSALGKLKAQHPRQYEVLLLHREPGFTMGQIARLLDCSEKTVSRDFDFARRFLNTEVRSARRK